MTEDFALLRRLDFSKPISEPRELQIEISSWAATPVSNLRTASPGPGLAAATPALMSSPFTPASNCMSNTVLLTPAIPSEPRTPGSYGTTKRGCSSRVWLSSLLLSVPSVPGTRRRMSRLGRRWGPGSSHWPAREYSRLSPMEAAIGDSPESQQCRPRRQDGRRSPQRRWQTVNIPSCCLTCLNVEFYQSRYDSRS